jgi:lysophospholipase L1-like esterase
MTPQMSEDNVDAMTAIAQRQGIKVMIASVPPAAQFPWAPGIETRGAIAELNRRLERLARRAGAIWVDYRPVLDDGRGAMKPGLASDGVHPTEAGYDAMAGVVEPVLRRILE